MWILFLVAAAVVAVLLVQQYKKREGYMFGGSESALDILKKRYARGEIDKDEYDRLRQDLKS